jgi:HD-like signal output (HDOD) protein
MINLNNLIQKTMELAPLPTSSMRLVQLIGNTDCDLEEIVELIVFDQALTLKLLRAANSAATASATRVSNVRDAVRLMGTDMVLTLALAAGAKPLLEKSISEYGLDEGAQWRHSVAAAVAAETLQAFGPVASPPESVTAALLHDVGKLIMARFLNPEMLLFIQHAKEDGLSEMEAESILLNVHHAELGGLIAQHWNLPPRVVQGITYHHNPEQGLDIICYLTYLANQLAKYIEGSLVRQNYNLNVPAAVAENLKLTPDTLNSLTKLAVSRYSQVSQRYNSI